MTLSKFNSRAWNTDIALLILRAFVGIIMLFSHGWGKMINLLAGETDFISILGLSEPIALALAVFSEIVCSALLTLGLFTRLALIPLMITMLVAVFIVHADDPFSKQEFGLLFLVPYFVLMLTGPGKYSLDRLINKR